MNGTNAAVKTLNTPQEDRHKILQPKRASLYSVTLEKKSLKDPSAQADPELVFIMARSLAFSRKRPQRCTSGG
jgi:hypothetical protein